MESSADSIAYKVRISIFFLPLFYSLYLYLPPASSLILPELPLSMHAPCIRHYPCHLHAILLPSLHLHPAGSMILPAEAPDSAACPLHHHEKKGRRKCDKCGHAPSEESTSYFFVDMGALCSDPPEVSSAADGRAMLAGLQVQQMLAGTLIHRFSHFPPPAHKQLVRHGVHLPLIQVPLAPAL